MSKILIIEDEQTIVDLISFNLKREGFEVDAAYDGITGLEKALSGWADLILLDVMLPGMNGFDLLGRLRQASDVPVIMVTAREEERDKVFGLETGADDYMTKPFSVKELIARIKANTRRKSGGNRQGGSRMGFGPYIVDTGLQEVRRADTAVELTQREYDLVCYFLTSAGRVISREELMEKVWGYDYYGDLRAVDVAMRRLREKLEEDPANPKYFMTKRGAGYYLQK
ncbi:MAG: response regulator transcription factor [Clostridiaceae bacterium]|nr:response regulator transcription factor [Clostridia bacterium]MDY3870794.1 response regulator transcription factor [Clostridiaceae bacterium]